MAVRLPTATRNAVTNVVTAAIDGGSGAATIEVRTGSQPASANDAATGTLLLTWTLADPSHGASSSGVATLDADPVISAVAAATGTAGWFRIKDSAGTTVLDGAVGTDLALDNTAIVAGQTVNLTAGTITTPASA